MEPHTLCVQISKLEHFKKQEEFSKLIFVLLFCLCSIGFFFFLNSNSARKARKICSGKYENANAFYPL